MNDVYELPGFIKSLDEINSSLRDFLKSINGCELIGFRELYAHDKASFFSTINEMILRGFKFKIANDNLFPKVDFDLSNYLYCQNNKAQNYKKIDFDVLGISGVINNLSINDDTFFNYVPIMGLIHFNKLLEADYIESLFANRGFTICNNEGKIISCFAEYNTTKECSATTSELCDIEITDCIHENNDINHDVDNNNQSKNSSKVFIGDVFAGDRFILFRNFCKNHNIQYIQDIDFNFIKSLEGQKKFDNKTIDLIMKKYKSWLNKTKVNDALVSSAKENIDYINTQMNDSKVLIEDVFFENDFNLFKTFCKTQGIKYIQDIDVNFIESLRIQSYFNNKKIDLIKERYEKWANESIKYELTSSSLKEDIYDMGDGMNNSKILIEDVFAEDKFKLFKRFCKKHDIRYFQDIDFNFIESLEDQKGFGSKKINLIKERYLQWSNLSLENDSSVLASTENPNLELKIVDEFEADRFKRFLLFCDQNNIVYISEINSDVLNQFRSVPGIGKAKIIRIKEKLKEISIKTSEKKKFIIEDTIEPVAMDITVKKLFDLLGLKNTCPENIYLEDINGKNYSDLYYLAPRNSIIILQKIVNKISKKCVKTIYNDSLEKAINNKNYENNQRNKVIYRDIILCHHTLNEVGSSLGITRERVRQLREKILRRLNMELEKARFYSILYILFYKQITIPEQELSECIGDNFSKNVIDSLEKFNEKKIDHYFLYWNSQLHCYSFDEIHLNTPELLLEDREYYDKLEILEECFDEWGEYFDNSDSKEIMHILKDNYGLNEYGDFLVYGKLSKVKAIEMIFKQYILGEIKLDENGCVKIRKLALDKLNMDFSEISNHALISKVRNSDKTILVGRNTWKFYRESKGIIKLMNEVYQFLLNYFKNNLVIEAVDVYDKYKSQCLDVGIHHYIGLYSYLKKYYQDAFSFPNGNELNIYRSNNKRVSRSEQLIDLFKKYNTFYLSKSQIIEETKWSDLKLTNIIELTPNVCFGYKKYYYLDGIKLSQDEVNTLREAYNQCKVDDYCIIYKLYDDLKFNPEFSNAIKKYHIENAKDLLPFYTYLPNIRKKDYFFFDKDSKKQGIQDILKTIFPEKVYLDDLRSYLNDNSIPERTIDMILARIESYGYAFIDRDLLVHKEILVFDENVVESVKEFVGNDEYLILDNYSGFRKHLPRIKYHWTPFLIGEILASNGYRKIYKRYHNYKYDPVIVVKNNSNIKNYPDLVYRFLNEHYEGSHSLDAVLEFLKKNHLVQNAFPYEIKHDKRFVIDEYNNIYWGE